MRHVRPLSKQPKRAQELQDLVTVISTIVTTAVTASLGVAIKNQVNNIGQDSKSEEE